MRPVAALCAFATLAAVAAEAPPDVDLASVLRLARDASPRLQIERQAEDVAKADALSAAAYPNPTVTYARTRPSGGLPLFEGVRQQDAGLELPLLVFGQRGARTHAAQRRIAAAEAHSLSAASDLAVEAGAAYIALAAAQERRKALALAAEEIARLLRIVAGRRESGYASEYDVSRLEVELASANARLGDADGDVADRTGALAAQVGLRDWLPRASEDLRSIETALARLAPAGPAESPAVAAARRDEEAAVSAIEAARRDRAPAVSLTAGRTWTSEPFGASNALGFSVEVPIFDTRRGALDKARAEANTAALRRELAQAEAEANHRRYAAAVQERAQAYAKLEEGAARRAPRLREMAEDAYRLGRGVLLDLLDASRSRTDLELARIDLLAGLAEARLRLAALESRLDLAASP